MKVRGIPDMASLMKVMIANQGAGASACKAASRVASAHPRSEQAVAPRKSKKAARRDRS